MQNELSNYRRNRHSACHCIGLPFRRPSRMAARNTYHCTIIAGTPIAIKAFKALRMKAFSIELLVTIAVIGALFIGEYVESAAVTFLFLIWCFS